ncbi:hypothetical protein J2Y86_004011 [Pseudomonas migulae]|nr:hypothetical protein [Pseudomonas migulae]
MSISDSRFIRSMNGFFCEDISVPEDFGGYDPVRLPALSRGK